MWKKLLSIIFLALGFASSAAQLNHITSGQLFFYIAVILLGVGVGLALWQYWPNLYKRFLRDSQPHLSEYTQDMLWGVIWRWHYKPEFDDKPLPRDLKPYCPECIDQPLMFIDEQQVNSDKGLVWIMRWQCSAHPEGGKIWGNILGRKNLWEVYALIRQRVESGEWKQAVLRQRAVMKSKTS